MDENLIKQQELYDRGWRKELQAGKEERGNLQTNLEFLAQTDLLKPKDRICGIGTVVNELSGKDHDIAGIDISSEAIEYGRNKYGDIRLEVQAAETLPYEDESFEVVLSFDLFEHIAAIDKHVSEVKRVFETRFVKMNPINEFTEKKLRKLGLLGHVFRHVDFRRMPLVLQTNLYVIANKIRK